MNASCCASFASVLVAAIACAAAEPAPPSRPAGRPAIIAHRGLLLHAPENTLANFRACLELKLGFELDVRRSHDGHLVCVHDDSVNRTTDGQGLVRDLSLARLQSLDAGSWFSPAFQGERIPTLDDVFAVLARHPPTTGLVAIDLKADQIEADVVRTARARGVLDRLLFIGTAIDHLDVRRTLRAADATAHVACLANNAAGLQAAIADPFSDWVYLRFVPDAAEIARVHAAQKLAFIAGAAVAGQERENWRRALRAGIDAILTDYPLELAREIRTPAQQPPAPPAQEQSMDQQFQRLAARFVDEYPALSPAGATSLGDHRHDRALDEISEQARQRQREFHQRFQQELAGIDRGQLSRGFQVDYQLLEHHLRRELWDLDRLQEWAWNPLVYTQLAGNAIYGLMARDFAPLEQRLGSVAARLEKYPELYEQVRKTLVPKRVPPVHAETAIKQNRGVLSIIDSQVRPHLDQLPESDRNRLAQAIAKAVDAVERHQKWLETELLPQAAGDCRLGPALYDEKLALTLASGLTRQQIRERAEFEMQRVRGEMYRIARRVHHGRLAGAELPEQPAPDVQQRAIEAALEQAYADVPPRDGVVAAAERSLKITTDFVRKHDLVSIPEVPLEIIIMPEFQRGVSVAYCDAPGPLDAGQKTFYAVAPLPDDWSDAQAASFLREYNLRSIHNLTVHEAMPGHFLQLGHANRYSSQSAGQSSPQATEAAQADRLRALLSSGVFVEGWACYTEQMLSEEGFLDRDPLMRLITLKWYLRTMANAILDQAIHVDGMGREEAMRLMMRDTFQEEREAAGKWIRAQLTSAQLATYFIGVQEHHDLRNAAKAAWGKDFTLKRYHDGVLAFGSPPTRFVKALLLNEPVPDR